MRHITLQHVEIAIGVFQAYSGRFPMEVQDILQNIWREKQKIVEERSKIAKEGREKDLENALEDVSAEDIPADVPAEEVNDVQQTIDNLSLSELAKE